MNSTYFAIDVEASGPVPPLYNLVSVGAVAVHEEQPNRFRIGGTWYRELKPIFPGFDPHAMAIHKLTEEYLRQNGTAPKSAFRQLNDWVEEQCDSSGAEAVFVGHNAVFDWAYVNYYYWHLHLPNPFGYKAIDTKSLTLGVLDVAWPETHKERLVREFPQLRMPPEDQVHNALTDAMFQAEIFVALMEDKASKRRR